MSGQSRGRQRHFSLGAAVVVAAAAAAAAAAAVPPASAAAAVHVLSRAPKKNLR